MIWLLAACVPKVEPQVFAADFPRLEPKARPAPVVQENECEPRTVQPGFVVDCSGLLIANRDAETCRYDEADLLFWEKEARSQWVWRTLDRSVCQDAVSAVRWELDATRKSDALHRRLVPVAFVGGVAVGAGVTVLLVEAVAASVQR